MGVRRVPGGIKQAVYLDGQENLVQTSITDETGQSAKLLREALQVYLSSDNMDASGRLRVSNLIALGDYKSIDDDGSLFYDTQGTGTVAHSTTDARFNMSVTAGQWAVMQTFQSHTYGSGKSHLPEVTFIKLAPETNIVKRAGYFSSNLVSPYDQDFDGIYLESSNGTVKLIINRIGTVTKSIEQVDWDDPLDGAGASGKTVNWQNFIPVFVDFLWLGGTGVRLWVNVDGEFVLAHSYRHSSNAAFTMIRQPSQPIRFEIRSTGGSGSFSPVCAAVSTEGSLSPVGIDRSVNSGITPCNANIIGTEYAVLGIRLKSTNLHDGIRIAKLSILSTIPTDNLLWQFKLNPTVAGAFTYNDVAKSSIQYAKGDAANTVTGGYVIDSDYAVSQAVQTIVPESVRRLGAALDGTPDTMVLTAIPLSINQDIYGAITWQELR